MLIMIALISSLVSATSVLIVEPVNGETYDSNWLTIRVIVENEDEIPDSVHYSLNGNSVMQITRLNTDWPTYMQNYRNHGYSDCPGPQTSEILWSAPICGELHEFPTPTVVDGTVYYPQDGYHLGDTLFALDAATGTIKWFEQVGYTDDTITYCNGLLYSSSDSLFCLNSENGDKLWAFHPGGEFHMTGSPIVVDNTVFFGSSIDFDTCLIFAADALNGEIIWQKGFPGAFETSFAYESGSLYMALYTSVLPPDNDESLYALNASDGSVIWSNDHVFDGYWDTSPCLDDGYLYIGGSDGCLHAFNTSDGTLVWERLLHDQAYYWGVEPTPALNDNALFVGCSFWGSPFGYVGAIGASNGNELWSWVDRMELHGSFGLSHDLAFMGANLSDSIFAFNQISGEIIWSYGYIGCKWDGCQSSPSITDGIMYIPATDGYLYAFGTGLKYTYLDDLFADIGYNELIATSFNEGSSVATDTISFTVTQTGITLEPSKVLNLTASPNPFSSTSSISFEIMEPGHTSVKVFDLTGRMIAILLDQEMIQGEHSVQWNGCTEDGRMASAGLYICRIESAGIAETAGLCLLK